jgi:transcription elongation factor SPT6
MQLRHFPVTAVPEGSDELDEESEWIYKQAFCRLTISNQVCETTLACSAADYSFLSRLAY